MMPQDIEAERIVLGMLMTDTDAYQRVADILTPKHFYNESHQLIYQAIANLKDNNNPTSFIAVCDELKKANALEKAGNVSYVVDLSGAVTTSVGLEYYCKIIAEKYLRRLITQQACETLKEGQDESVDLDNALEHAYKGLERLQQYAHDDDFEEMDTVLRRVQKNLQDACNSDGITGIPSGFIELDGITSGFHPGELIVVAGRPGMGKTIFALCLAKHAAVVLNIPTAFFSLEMTNEDLGKRLLSNQSKVNSKLMDNGKFEQEDWRKIDLALGQMQGHPIYFNEMAGMTINKLCSKARRIVQEKGVQLILIDYMQLIQSEANKHVTRQEMIAEISRQLKLLAKDLKIPVIVLSQLNRNIESREGVDGKRPHLSDLRDSGSIEQDADLVMFIHRPEYYGYTVDKSGNDLRGIAQIIIAKHRKGALGQVDLKFTPQYSQFEDQA